MTTPAPLLPAPAPGKDHFIVGVKPGCGPRTIKALRREIRGLQLIGHARILAHKCVRFIPTTSGDTTNPRYPQSALKMYGHAIPHWQWKKPGELWTHYESINQSETLNCSGRSTFFLVEGSQDAWAKMERLMHRSREVEKDPLNPKQKFHNIHVMRCVEINSVYLLERRSDFHAGVEEGPREQRWRHVRPEGVRLRVLGRPAAGRRRRPGLRRRAGSRAARAARAARGTAAGAAARGPARGAARAAARGPRGAARAGARRCSQHGRVDALRSTCFGLLDASTT